ncbi:type VII secretion-associated protein [Mycobacterium sp. ML4]
MTAHRAVVVAGPGVVRRPCCGTTEISDCLVAAVDAIDDPVALVDERPIAVDALWCAVLRSLADGHCGMTVVHPSWWPASRTAVVTAAARAVGGDDAEVRPRSWLLTQHPSVLVEIAERLVAITARELVAVPRLTDEQAVAREVGRVVSTSHQDNVLIDAPGAVCGAPQLAALIAGVVGAGRTVTTVDDEELDRLVSAAALIPGATEEPVPGPRSSGRPVVRLVLAGAAASMVGLAVAAGRFENPRPTTEEAATTVLVEGRVALTVPASWPARRVLGGPGSARLQLTSPSDPETALLVTQTPTPGETPAGSAERLRRALDAERAGVFVDFNPAGNSAGRPAVTYREVRTAHEVRWSVFLDGSVRISVGCQSSPADWDAVRAACDQAVRTAHALD